MSTANDFIYLRSMKELADWRPESISAAHVSNTPLFQRPLRPPTSPKIRDLLICHDFKGSYVPSEAPQGIRLSQEDAAIPPYTTEYLHLATTFVYFSHNRVSIPPASWINVCHRAGVKVLGTFLVEGSEGSSEAGRLFERGSEGEFLYATQLAQIAEEYGFDGWLFNIESSFPRPWSIGSMQLFLRELKSGMGKSREVVWYDAVTILNTVHHQNALTLLNAPFLAASDSLFTNYWWGPLELSGSSKIRDVMGKPVYMGIDVYGRGTPGGGGFKVDIPLSAIQQHGLDVALFAPGWTWENFGGKDFRAHEKTFWSKVAEKVAEHPSGTTNGFYTNFNRGFGSALSLRGNTISNTPWVHLGAQSLLPTFPLPESVSYDDTRAFTGGCSLKFSPVVGGSAPSISREEKTYVPLYKLGVRFTPSLVFEYAVSTTASGAGIYWELYSPSTKERKRNSAPFTGGSFEWTISTLLVGEEDEGAGFTVVEVGIYFTPGTQEPVWLGELCFKTLPEDEDGSNTISSVVAKAGARKVTWNVYGPGERTKGFAWFVVWRGSEYMGIAHACEFMVGGGDVGTGWRVQGVTWEGEVVDGLNTRMLN